MNRAKAVQGIFSERFLIRRPLLQALDAGQCSTCVADQTKPTAPRTFRGVSAGVLSDFQITIPEIGTIKAKEPPIVVLTSNRTREIHGAVKRRCLYWVTIPPRGANSRSSHAGSDAPERLSQEVVAFVQKLRSMDLFKLPA